MQLSCSKLDLFIDTKPAATRLKVEEPFSLCPFVALLSAASLGFVYGRSCVRQRKHVDSLLGVEPAHSFVDFFSILFLCGRVFCLRVCLCTSVQCSRGQERVSDSLRLELASCELPWGCWGLNVDPLEEQPVSFLTAEPSLQ